MPKVIIIAGPNGAGKTTFARSYLPNEAQTIPFVNADLIAAGLSPFDPGLANVAAGKIMLARIDALASEGVDFAIETTLSGKWLKDHILRWQSQGYSVYLYYLCLPSVEVSLNRIQQRVLNGGHDIPEPVARRRFQRSLDLLEGTYKDLVDDWYVCDNEGDEPILIERKQ